MTGKTHDENNESAFGLMATKNLRQGCDRQAFQEARLPRRAGRIAPLARRTMQVCAAGVLRAAGSVARRTPAPFENDMAWGTLVTDASASRSPPLEFG